MSHDSRPPLVTGLLASVADLAEARLVAAAGVDIIDLKNPAAGALGALPAAEVAAIVQALGGERPISATIGDLPMEPGRVIPVVRAMAGARVDYVKIGLFPGGDRPGVLRGLEPLAAAGVRLVAVGFGDLAPEPAWVAELAGAGFAGVMLDTADKRRGSLRDIVEPGLLREFVAAARAYGLLCGLAGSLRLRDIPPLRELGPDYLGFRGALCGGQRTGGLDPEALRQVLAAVRRSPRESAGGDKT